MCGKCPPWLEIYRGEWDITKYVTFALISLAMDTNYMAICNILCIVEL